MIRYLLDTHVYLWWLSDDARLSEHHRRILRDPDEFVMFSVVSLFEMSIKSGLGKLRYDRAALHEAVEAEVIELLPLDISHCEALESLPLLHRDPFDRMLVAQAQVEGLVLLSQDNRVLQYPGVAEAHRWRVQGAPPHPYQTRRRRRPVSSESAPLPAGPPT